MQSSVLVRMVNTTWFMSEKLVKPEPDYQITNEPPVGVEIAEVHYTLRFSGLHPTDIQQMIAVISRRNCEISITRRVTGSNC